MTNVDPFLLTDQEGVRVLEDAREWHPWSILDHIIIEPSLWSHREE